MIDFSVDRIWENYKILSRKQEDSLSEEFKDYDKYALSEDVLDEWRRRIIGFTSMKGSPFSKRFLSNYADYWQLGDVSDDNVYIAYLNKYKGFAHDSEILEFTTDTNTQLSNKMLKEIVAPMLWNIDNLEIPDVIYDRRLFEVATRTTGEVDATRNEITSYAERSYPLFRPALLYDHDYIRRMSYFSPDLDKKKYRLSMYYWNQFQLSSSNRYTYSALPVTEWLIPNTYLRDLSRQIYSRFEINIPIGLLGNSQDIGLFTDQSWSCVEPFVGDMNFKLNDPTNEEKNKEDLRKLRNFFISLYKSDSNQVTPYDVWEYSNINYNVLMGHSKFKDTVEYKRYLELSMSDYGSFIPNNMNKDYGINDETPIRHLGYYNTKDNYLDFHMDYIHDHLHNQPIKSGKEAYTDTHFKSFSSTGLINTITNLGPDVHNGINGKYYYRQDVVESFESHVDLLTSTSDSQYDYDLNSSTIRTSVNQSIPSHQEAFTKASLAKKALMHLVDKLEDN